MENKKELGYDDPHRKKIVQHETVETFIQTFDLFIAGIANLEKLSRSEFVDDITKKEIKKSAIKLNEELKLLHKKISKFVESNNIKNLLPIEQLMRRFDQGPHNISLNETTYEKVKKTINRIKEVNKKLNHEIKK